MFFKGSCEGGPMYRITVVLLVVLLFISCGTIQTVNDGSPAKKNFSQELTTGMSLNELGRQVSYDTKWRMADLGVWIDNKIFLYEVTPKYTLLVSNNLFQFGVLVNGTNPYFLIDIDGDSILDVQTNFLHVPYWVVATNSIEDARNRNVMFLFDYWYQVFQNNESPRNSSLVRDLSIEYYEAANDTAYINRDLIYLHSLYDELFAAGEYDLALRYLDILDNESQSRYRIGTHIIILIYTVESLYKIHDYDRAIRVNNTILQHIPDCIPSLVYQVLLETDAIAKNRLREALLSKHGEHWLVREKLNTST
jgi:tetratricopeptide (TPR) repeat protein